MLVLTRKYQEKIRIGDNITITVLRTKGKAVRLGIEAPDDVPVVRGELTFETSAVSTDESLEASGTAPAAVRHAAARRGTSTPDWATDSPRPQIEMRRMSRSQVPNFLPKLVEGAGPLRAMMEQR